MLFSDTIIEKDHFFLRNMIKTALAKDVWSTATGSYGMFDCQYENNVKQGHLYYARFTYKFTTTNQSPTWVRFYIQDGMRDISQTNISNPTANTEYTSSGIGTISITGSVLSFGTIYNGNSNAISGLSSQVKNVLLYDVTELYATLKALNIATTETALKTWCDTNLEYTAPNINYDITSLISDSSKKVFIKGGSVITSEFIEPDGMRFYSTSDGIRNNTYFDTGMPFGVYNNSGGGTVTHTRVSAAEQNSPFAAEHPYVCKITTNGTASPGAGGFHLSHTAAANKIFIERFVAKIPVGYTVTAAYNAQGTGAQVSFLTSNVGTGDWAEYAILYKCGSEGSFSTGGHVYISGSNNTSVTWYVAYANNCDITENEYLKNFTILKNIERIKEDKYFSNQFNTLNLLAENTEDIGSTINSNWTIDTSDYAGNSTFSIVQPVNAVNSTYGEKIPIIIGQRYKVSYWVKCKGDMTSFLTAIRVFVGNTEVTHPYVNYITGTKTQLTAALNNGATSMTVKSNANWKTYSYSRLGFRSGSGKSWCDLGLSNGYNGSTGLISGISGTTTVNFNTAYTGNTIAANTYVVEAFDGNTHPYPIGKAALPTDNTWKYVEGYFGATGLWDGAVGTAWQNLPYDATHILLHLNIYTNTGTVPIKYSDIRIEPVSGNGRKENKIQIIGGN